MDCKCSIFPDWEHLAYGHKEWPNLNLQTDQETPYFLTPKGIMLFKVLKKDIQVYNLTPDSKP